MLCYADRPPGLTALLARAVERAPDREAVVDAASASPGGRSTTARGGWPAAWRGSASSPATGSRPCSRTGRRSAWPTFAALELGALVVPLSTKLRREELRFLLGDAAPRVLLADPAFYGEVEPLRAELPAAAHVLAGASRAPGTLSLDDLLGGTPWTDAAPRGRPPTMPPRCSSTPRGRPAGPRAPSRPTGTWCTRVSPSSASTV